jgi:hypothetical protein
MAAPVRCWGLKKSIRTVRSSITPAFTQNAAEPNRTLPDPATPQLDQNAAKSQFHRVAMMPLAYNPVSLPHNQGAV